MNPLRIASMGLTALLALSGCSQQATLPDSTPQPLRSGLTDIISPQTSAEWYQYGAQQAERRQQQQPNRQRARNLVVVIGDGMGITSLTSGRIFAGQQLGLDGEEFHLSFESLPYSALVKTYNTDRQTPDSAGTMTAIMTGTKTRSGVINIGPQSARGDCSGARSAGLETLFDLAHQQQKATGVVTTTRITHATPAATYARSPERNWEADSQLTEAARLAGCRDIADQLLDSDIDIILGGGARMFRPAEAGGIRADQRDLTQLWQQQPNHFVVRNRESLLNADLSQGRWLGLFADSHLPYVDERPETVPGLLDMTQAAVERLSSNEQGFTLVIEAGRIDHAHHAGNGYRALAETRELHQTVQWLTETLDLSDTLLLVTADHSHTLTLAGYPTRGNPINGVVRGNDDFGRPSDQPVILEDGQPYTSMNYRNGPGAVAMPRPGVTDDEALSKDYRQQALVPLESETHGGEDVAVYAAGPYADLLGGTMEQHWLYHLMRHAISAPVK